MCVGVSECMCMCVGGGGEGCGCDHIWCDKQKTQYTHTCTRTFERSTDRRLASHSGHISFVLVTSVLPAKQTNTSLHLSTYKTISTHIT